MASQVHAIFCFETLAAQLERRSLPSLAEVEASWEEFTEATTAHECLSPTPPTSSTTDSSSTPVSVDSSSSASVFSPPSSLLSKALRSSSSRAAPDEAPLFITWNTIQERTGDKHLRGCIGTFAAQSLEQGLRTYALTAALEDTRFSPISAAELASLECGVTLLTDFEECSDPYDWTLGTHGLRVSFRDGSSRRTGSSPRYSATFLPDVAPEQGWTQEETLQSLVRKAGWSGRRSEWHTGTRDFTTTRYQGRKVGVPAKTWQAWRSWRDNKGA